MKEIVERIGQKRTPITPQLKPNAELFSKSPNNMEISHLSMRYRDWQIGTKVIHGHLWLQWQHPQERFPRYAIQVPDNCIVDTIRHAQLLIDLVISLEQEATGDTGCSRLLSPENTNGQNSDSHVDAYVNNSSAVVIASDTWDEQEFSLIENRWG